LSYQSITTGDRNLPVIAVFQDTLLRGKLISVERSAPLGLYSSARVRSFVVQGRESWNVLTSTGKSFCLTPPQSLKWPLCLVLDVTSSDTSMPNHWIQVRKGCQDESPVVLRDCREAYSGKLEKLTSYCN